VTDPWIVLLFPMFFASNYFYTYQFNGKELGLDFRWPFANQPSQTSMPITSRLGPALSTTSSTGSRRSSVLLPLALSLTGHDSIDALEH
jgi:hypothetical protein